MVGWRTLASVVSLAILASSAQAQSYALREKTKTDTYFHVALHMELKGKLLVQQGGKVESLEQQAKADHDYVERVLQADDDGLIQRTARYYQSARAEIAVKPGAGDANKSERSLPADRPLIVTQRLKQGGLLSYSPGGPMTREELDLFDHFDTMALAGLLPNKEVAVGADWKLSDAAAQGLCFLEGLINHSLTGKLTNVKDKKASFSVTGDARGIYAGAEVKLKITATGVFDLASSRVESLMWTQQDDREQGPASPAMSAQVTVKLTREEVQPVQELSNINAAAAIAAVNQPTPPADKTTLKYRDPEGRYQLQHDRAWMLVARTNEHTVLRLLDRGDFVAQVSISCWPNAGAGKHASEDDFKAAMERNPGWVQGTVKDAKTLDGKDGYWTYRLAVEGTLNNQPTVQYFYLVAGPNGDQAVLAFALSPNQAEKLGRRDEDLVRSLSFIAGATPAPAPKSK